ncbi:MAG: hypothetical protein KDD56_03425 [Bdellovibrionales bacterium]|nr:hypothetical protein [Bdellovibrionales bacterium]
MPIPENQNPEFCFRDHPEDYEDEIRTCMIDLDYIRPEYSEDTPPLLTASNSYKNTTTIPKQSQISSAEGALNDAEKQVKNFVNLIGKDTISQSRQFKIQFCHLELSAISKRIKFARLIKHANPEQAAEQYQIAKESLIKNLDIPLNHNLIKLLDSEITSIS